MIALLNGVLKHKQSPFAIIDCGGVGYEVELSANAFANLPNMGENTTLYTHFSVREDAQVLFGFKDFDERDLFRILIKVNGVGPKVAIAMLSGMSATDLVQAITQGDAKQLIKLPGVGKKMAERLTVELGDKFDHLIANVPNNQASTNQQSLSNTQTDAVSALTSMGYKLFEAEKMIAAVSANNTNNNMAGSTVEDLIKQALKTQVK